MINGIVAGETVACQPPPPPVCPRVSCFNLSEVEKKELEGVVDLLEDFILFSVIPLLFVTLQSCILFHAIVLYGITPKGHALYIGMAHLSSL